MSRKLHILLDLANCSIELEAERNEFTIKLTALLGRDKCQELTRIDWKNVGILLDFVKRLINLMPVPDEEAGVMGP